MLQKCLLILCVLSAAILIGCSTTETSNSNSNANNSNAGSGTTSGTSTSGTSTSGANTTASAEKIGIPECDDFLTKYEACVTGKVPEVARAQYQAGLKQWRDSWKKMAENPATKGSLAAACKQARETQEAALKSYGCTW